MLALDLNRNHKPAPVHPRISRQHLDLYPSRKAHIAG
jgi:hypothetical protein